MSDHQEKINAIKQTFSPKIKFGDVQDIAENHVEVESDAFYELIEELTSKRTPSFKDDYESKWEYFYLPIARAGTLICTAVSLFLSYKKSYHVTFTDFSRFVGFSQYGGATVNKGTHEVPQDYALILDEISRFMPFVQEYGHALLEELYPYAWRSGRIKRKYICEPSSLISKAEGDKLLAAYQEHLEKNLTITEISLNDYLTTAAICYQAAFPEDIAVLLQRRDVTEVSPELLHERWADSRHGGMLVLEDPNSKKEYMDWYRSRQWEGAHPFEIVYSGNVHGISLYPPDEREPLYRIGVVDPFYNYALLKMVAALIENNVPFTTYKLEDIVEYCVGEAYIGVNTASLRYLPFRYSHTQEEQETYFSHIEWDKIQILEPVDGLE